MTSTNYQGKFPFNAATPPVGEPTLYADQFDQGDPSRGNWALVPGFTAPMPGTQFPPSQYRWWDPSNTAPPPVVTSLVDVNRGAIITQSQPPLGPEDYLWSGNTVRTPSTQAWAIDDDQFLLQLFTRVGVNNQQLATDTPNAGFAGMIVSIADLAGATDGAFLAFGIIESNSGPRPCVSKWSNHRTLIDQTNGQAACAAAYFVRALLLVDPEDGVQMLSPEWSTDGMGWVLFGNEPEDFQLFGESSQLTVGVGGTGYLPFATGISGVIDSAALFGPYADNANERYRLRLLSNGGRNWA